MIALAIARLFAVISGLLGLAYLGSAVLLICTPDPPGSATPGLSLGIVGISILPAILGFYLLYSYTRLSFRLPTYFHPMTIWITTVIFNLLGMFLIPGVRYNKQAELIQQTVYYLRFWPTIAVCLAILNLRNGPSRFVPPTP